MKRRFVLLAALIALMAVVAQQYRRAELNLRREQLREIGRALAVYTDDFDAS